MELLATYFFIYLFKNDATHPNNSLLLIQCNGILYQIAVLKARHCDMHL